MAKGARFFSESEGTKHVSQPAIIAHHGSQYFFPKGAFLTEREDDDSTGSPILLGENGRLDYSLLPGVLEFPTDYLDGDYIPSNGYPVQFELATTSSATTANDYIEIARIELSGNYSGGWIDVNGVVGETSRENHPIHLVVQGSTEGTGTAQASVVTLTGRPSGCNFFVYLEVDGGGSGIHYYHVYYKSTNNWNSLKATVRGFVSDSTDCEITVWQEGNNVGESTPTGTLYQANNWWGVNDELRLYDGDLSDYAQLYRTDAAFYITSVDDPLYLNSAINQNIYCFASIASGNPQFKVYGYQTATGAKYVDMYVAADGAGWVRGETYLRLCGVGDYVDILPNNANYGMVLRKHDSASTAGSPYANFFVEDATVDYLNIVLGQVGSALGLVIDDNDNLGVNKLPTAGYKIDANGIIRGTQLYSTVATGTSPLTVTSTTKVTNLNADTLDGYHSTSFPQLVADSGASTQKDITADNTWRDLDVTSETSADATWVYLWLHVYANYDTHTAEITVCAYNDDAEWAKCEVHCGSRIAYDAHGSGNLGPTYNDMCVWVPLDSEQRFSYKATESAQGFVGGSTAHIHILGYIEEK